MAFEILRRSGEPGFRRRRWIALALAALVHGVVIGAGVAYSYWHVDELTPPRLRVTFMSVPPPPPPTPELARGRESPTKRGPPPPPPAGRRAGGEKVAVKERIPEPVSPPPAEIVQPPERPILFKQEFRRHDDEYDEPDNARTSASVAGHKDSIDGNGSGEGQGVGATDGKPGGVGAPEGPRSVSWREGSLLKESGNMPPFSSTLMHDKKVYVVQTRICVSATGAVYKLTITKRSGTVLDASVIDTVKTWHYRPMTVNDKPVSFCYPVKFEFRSES